MKKKVEGRASPDKGQHARQPARLPGFITDEDVGLGDLIKRATSYIGIKPCGGCERRAAALNRWTVLTGRHSR